MSVYSANQYDGAFQPQRLQNWSEPKRCRERPTAQEGHTTFIANNRGHLLPVIKRGPAWPLFKGTWALPARLPARCIDPTGRSAEGLMRLRAWGVAPRHGSRNTDRLQDVSQHTMETNGEEQQDDAGLSAKRHQEEQGRELH